MRSTLPATLALVLTAATATSASAQRGRGLTCRDHDESDWGETVCTIREQSLRPGSGPIRVDAHPNGGVTVIGWDRNEISLRTRVQAHARTEEEAQHLVDQVKVVTDDRGIRADGPTTGRRQWWSASFELRVPKSSGLTIRANNGGISVEGVQGEMDLSTVNGGLTLSAVSGNVRAETTNGGVDVELSGDRWTGTGLDVRTTNGGVDLTIPERYSAELEARTVNGGLDIDFPVTVQGRLSKRLNTTLGSGGPPIRAATTNGGISLHRAR
jgi:hypothetical protein